MKWGFSHLGRFAQQYRQLFNELPSAVIKRNKKCPHSKSVKTASCLDPEIISFNSVICIKFGKPLGFKDQLALNWYRIYVIFIRMAWIIIFSDEYEKWFGGLDKKDQTAVAIDLSVLETMGPTLGKPYVDHVNDSQYSNMKELRTRVSGHVYRSFFAFDPDVRLLF